MSIYSRYIRNELGFKMTGLVKKMHLNMSKGKQKALLFVEIFIKFSPRLMEQVGKLLQKEPKQRQVSLNKGRRSNNEGKALLNIAL